MIKEEYCQRTISWGGAKWDDGDNVQKERAKETKKERKRERKKERKTEKERERGKEWRHGFKSTHEAYFI